MKAKERYQQYLDTAYQFAPFKLLGVIDTKDPIHCDKPHSCQVCGNKRLRYLCQCRDKTGVVWYIGSECWTELFNRQFTENLIANT